MSRALLADIPELDDQRLRPGLGRFVGHLAAVVGRLPTGVPLLVTGDWGAGKTTALQGLRRRLDPEGMKPRTVWFNPWYHERAGSLLPSLLRAIWEATPETRRQEGDLFRRLWGAAWAVVSLGAPVAAAAAGLPPFVGTLLEKGRDAAASAPGWEDPTPEVDPVRALWSQVGELVATTWTDPARPLVVIIDDLDRCAPDQIVGLVDAIRLLVDGAMAEDVPMRFVVALDRGVVAKAVSHKFQGLAGYDGNRYLEKVFPVVLAVPPADTQEMAALLAHLLGSDGLGFSGDQADALRGVLQNPLFANPRLAKRVVNRFRMLLDLEGGPSDAEADRVMAAWLAATDRWPALRRVFGDRDAAFQKRFVEIFQGVDPGTMDPTALALIAEEGFEPWVRGAGRRHPAELARAEQRLRRVGL